MLYQEPQAQADLTQTRFETPPGRRFFDIMDLGEPLTEWNATTADQRVHGTTLPRMLDNGDSPTLGLHE